MPFSRVYSWALVPYRFGTYSKSNSKRPPSKPPWCSKDVQNFVVWRMVAVEEMRFDVTLGAKVKGIIVLTRILEAIGIAAIDRLLGSIRPGIERNDARESEHRAAELSPLSSLHMTGLICGATILLCDLVNARSTSVGRFTVRIMWVILKWCGAHWKNGWGSCTFRFMRNDKRKKLFWTIFANSVFDEEGREA